MTTGGDGIRQKKGGFFGGGVLKPAHVETGAGQCPTLEGVEQGFVVDELAAGSVDQEGALLDVLQRFAVDHPGVFRGTVTVERPGRPHDATPQNV